MANTIISPLLFAKEVIAKRDQKNVFMNYVNRDYEGQLKKAWHSVDVQVLPTLNLTASSITNPWVNHTVGTWPGGAITATDFTITRETLVINKFIELRIKISEFEKTQSNLTLEEKLAERYVEAEQRLMDAYVRDMILVDQVADIPAGNKINSATPVTLTKTNVIDELEKMIVALDTQNVSGERVLFVPPSAASLYRLANIFDASDKGLTFRQNGYLGTYGGVQIVQSNALTASKEMIMMAKDAPNVVVQITEQDVRQGADGFYENFIATVVWGGKIFTENAKAIAINYVA